MEMLVSEGLPSSLQPLLIAVDESLENEPMTAGDVAQWAAEQCRDVRRLSKHLQDVRATVKPLQEDLKKAKAEQEKLCSELDQVQKKFKREISKHGESVVQLEFTLREAQRSVKHVEQKLQEEQKQHKKGGKY